MVSCFDHVKLESVSPQSAAWLSFIIHVVSEEDQYGSPKSCQADSNECVETKCVSCVMLSSATRYHLHLCLLIVVKT